MVTDHELLIHALRHSVYPLPAMGYDWTVLLDFIGNARFVLLGEATHGTHDFYELRAQITQKLIQEKGFNVVIIESDWPDAYRVNQFVVDQSQDKTPVEALSGYQRFPLWMWRNTEMVNFIDWLRHFNDQQPGLQSKVGFFGMDLYSLYASIDAVLSYLEAVDPLAAKQARYRYSCFEQFADDPQAYGYATHLGINEPCEQQVIEQLIALERRSLDYSHRNGTVAEDEFFSIEQNARLIKNAEAYYRIMYQGNVQSWNHRDQHMVETVEEITDYLTHRNGRPAKVVIWAHNSHLGDARATDMSWRRQEHNVGQLMRELFNEQIVNIGFTTYSGKVIAASKWDGPIEQKSIQPALKDSLEDVFHEVGIPNLLWLPNVDSWTDNALKEPRLERAIGVIYLPQSERLSHYFYVRPSDQFDAFIHIDQTQALTPLDAISFVRSGEEETYPFAV